MWLRAFLMRLFRVPVRVVIQRMEIGPDDLPGLTEQLKAMAGIFHIVPGLREQWMDGLNEVITKMAKTPATDAYHGERIRLCERAVCLWQNLQLPKNSADRLNAFTQKVEEVQQIPDQKMVI